MKCMVLSNGSNPTRKPPSKGPTPAIVSDIAHAAPFPRAIFLQLIPMGALIGLLPGGMMVASYVQSPLKASTVFICSALGFTSGGEGGVGATSTCAAGSDGIGGAAGAAVDGGLGGGDIAASPPHPMPNTANTAKSPARLVLMALLVPVHVTPRRDVSGGAPVNCVGATSVGVLRRCGRVRSVGRCWQALD